MTVAKSGEQQPALEVDGLGVRGHGMTGVRDHPVDDDQSVGVGADAVDPDRATVEYDDRHGNLLETTPE